MKIDINKLDEYSKEDYLSTEKIKHKKRNKKQKYPDKKDHRKDFIDDTKIDWDE